MAKNKHADRKTNSFALPLLMLLGAFAFFMAPWNRLDSYASENTIVSKIIISFNEPAYGNPIEKPDITISSLGLDNYGLNAGAVFVDPSSKDIVKDNVSVTSGNFGAGTYYYNFTIQSAVGFVFVDGTYEPDEITQIVINGNSEPITNAIVIVDDNSDAYSTYDVSYAITIVAPSGAGGGSGSGSAGPSNDYLADFRNELNSAVKNGGSGTITLKNCGDSLPEDIMRTLSENPNLTLVFEYTYDGVDYVATIPGSRVVLEKDTSWYGPINLYNRYGTSATKDGVTKVSGTYTVVKDDNLWNIARRFGVTLKSLLSKNTISNPDLIYPGQTINY